MSAYRHLLSMDAEQYLQHLLRLDADSRYARFSAITSDATIRRYVDDIDWHWCNIVGYFDDGKLRGAGEIRYRTSLFPKSAELAFSVEREYQNTRIGTNLMARSLIILRNRHIDTAYIVCLLSNTRMQKLALRYRADREAYSGDVFLSINVPHGTMATLLSEMTDGYIGWMNTSLDLALKLPRPSSLRSSDARNLATQ
jgi:GNAT superfamily N-acetyltransferase